MALQEPTHKVPQRLTELFLILTVLTIACVAYYPSLSGPLILDDLGSVLPSKISELSFAELYRVATSDQSGIFGRSIPVISFALNLHFWPDSVYALKVTNLVIHLFNSILVLLLARSVLQIAIPKATEKEINLISIACAAVWVIHPLQVSTTMYVVQRMAMLATTFTIIALLSYIRIRKSHSLPAFKLSIASLNVMFFTILACLCKENGVLVFLYILVLEIFLFRFQYRESQTKSQLITLWSICCFIPLMMGCLLFFHLYDRLMITYVSRNFDLYERLITEPGVIMMYVKMILLPNPNEMQFYYDAYPVVTSLNRGFEHRNYFSIFCLVVPIVWVLTSVSKEIRRTYLAVIPLVSVFLILAVQTHSRSIEWSDPVTLKLFTLSADPKSVRARSSLVVDYYERNNPEKAIELLREGLVVHPDNTRIPALLYHVLTVSGQVEDKDVEMIKEKLATGRVEKSTLFEFIVMQRAVLTSDVDIDPRVLRSFYEIVLANQNSFLGPRTKGQFMESYALLLDY